MKKLKTVLTLLIVAALLAGLFVGGLNQNRVATKQEFLFDTLCTISVYLKRDADAMENAFDAAAEIHHLTDFYSTDSDTSKINNAKANKPISVDSHTINMLMLAQEINEKSNGAFDISIAPISRLWKFKDENPTPPAAEQINVLLSYVGSDALVIDAKDKTVTKKYDNVQIDLGAIAKGYAADIAAKVLKAEDVKSGLIDFGGNIVTIGENPKTNNKKWRIGLQTPYAPTGDYSKIVEIHSGAAVTSGTYQRYFEYNGTRYHHIIDPKTGYPANRNYESVTVVADSGALCDCLATAIFVMGEDSGKKLAEEFNAQVYFLP